MSLLYLMSELLLVDSMALLLLWLPSNWALLPLKVRAFHSANWSQSDRVNYRCFEKDQFGPQARRRSYYGQCLASQRRSSPCSVSGHILRLGFVSDPNLNCRQAALGAGIPNTVPCTTVNKVCASGMKSTFLPYNYYRISDSVEKETNIT